ncbi:MAG: hypothetical protein ACREGE_01420 [Candidatus Microsaccharimonas sp.]
MELANKDRVAADLEQGLGEIHWIARGFHSSLRLRMAVCGLTSIALAEKFAENNYDVELVVSSPNIPGDPETQHVLPVVRHKGQDVLVDATYSQFMEYVGLTPGYVVFGGEDLYPKDKIRIIGEGESDAVATELRTASQYFLKNRQPIPEIDWKGSVFDGVSEEDQEALLRTIWNENNFDTFTPDKQTLEAGRKLAKFITTEHVRLVD